MARSKKRRHTREWVEYEETGPNRAQRLADPLSKESLKRKAHQKKRIKKSLYQRHVESQTTDTEASSAHSRATRLSEKIKTLTASKG